MFRLHETTRRRVCRTAFVVLCAAPTIGTLAWIAHARRPWRVEDEQRRLGGLLHVDVHCADWRTPRPGVAAASQLYLGAPAGGRRLAELFDVTWQRDGALGQVATIESISVDADRLAEVGEHLRHWIDAGVDRSCQLLVREVTIRSPRGTVAFQHVRVHIDRDESGPAHVRVISRPAGAAQDGGELRLAMDISPPERERPSAPVATLVATLDAAAAPLPGWLLAPLAPMVGELGDAATFSGSVQIRSTGDAVSGSAQGTCRRVLLASCLSPQAAHHAEGEATLRIDALRWQNAKIVELAADVSGEHLRVSRKLVEAAGQFLDLRPIDVKAGGDELLAIDRLSARIQLTSDGLTITGHFTDESALPPGCIAAAGGRAMIMQGRPLYPAAWVQFAEGPAESWVPATAQAIERAARLPLSDGEASSAK